MRAMRAYIEYIESVVCVLLIRASRTPTSTLSPRRIKTSSLSICVVVW